MNSILLYSEGISPRLKYIANLVLHDLLGLDVRITADQEEFIGSIEPKICYNTRPLSTKECLIIPAGLINERGVNVHQINIINFADTKALFPVYIKESCLPFDIFSASFFMVSRYEEYLPYIRDNHNRFSAFSSLAHQKDFLQKPVVNIWALEFGKILKNQYPQLNIKQNIFQFIPTIDIDAAWAFKHKGFYRSVGGFLKDLRILDREGIRRRFRSLMNIEEDPFDTYQYMHNIHMKYGLEPLFFILYAGYDTFDKNTPINNPWFRQLIKSLEDEGEVGIHPSYASNTTEGLLKKEVHSLSEVIHKEITSSRQHFLRLHLPDTYRNLIASDITDDYTMGFAAKTGFRAGICTSFYWYDIEMERATTLRVHPFAVMDGTLRDYLNLNTEEALSTIKDLIDSVKTVGGTFISLFHNESFSEWRRWEGWRNVYEQMLNYAFNHR